jgi:hypothetical protein
MIYVFYFKYLISFKDQKGFLEIFIEREFKHIKLLMTDNTFVYWYLSKEMMWRASYGFDFLIIIQSYYYYYYYISQAI